MNLERSECPAPIEVHRRRVVAWPGFVVLCAHFYPEVTKRLREQYAVFRRQFIGSGVPLRTIALGSHYSEWARECPEIKVVAGDLMFQKERLWSLAAKAAAEEGFERFLCLDADILFQGHEWCGRIGAAFERSDIFHPLRRVAHLYDDARVQRRSVVAFPFTVSARLMHGIVPLVHRAYSAISTVFRRTRPAYGFGVGFNLKFLDEVGLYEYAIVGGGDGLLWSSLMWVLPGRSRSERESRLARFLAEDCGFPSNPALGRSILEWLEAGRRRISSLRIGNSGEVDAVSLPSGRVVNRRYRARYELLDSFDPDRDLRAMRGQGLTFAPDAASALRIGVAEYMRARQC